MRKLELALLAIVAVLLVVLIIDRGRATVHLEELTKSIDNLNRALERGVMVAPGDGRPRDPTATPRLDDESPEPAVAIVGERDGNPKLGVDFLLPYDGTSFRREWLGGTLKYFMVDPKGLNALIDNSTINSAIHNLCNDSLCDRPARTPEQWQQNLAESVIISDDYKTYTFTLRPGVMWQRPAIARQAGYAWMDRDVPLTSADFAFTLQMIMDPAVDCSSTRNYYEDLDKVETPDDRTLIVRWKRKVYTSLSGSLGISPMARHIYTRNPDGSEIPPASLGVSFNKHWFDQHTVAGVGAYILESYVPKEKMVFRRNPAYWGASLHFERIEWNLKIREDDPKLIAFKNGQAHFEGLQPLKYKSEILDRGEPRFVPLDENDPKAGRAGELGWERFKAMSFTYIGWNMRRPPFDDKRVRQAMSHAFPKQRLIRDVFFDLGLPVLSDVLLDSQYCNKDLVPYAFDLERAKAMLEQAGWKDHDGDGVIDRTIDGKRVPFAFEVKYYANSPEWDNTLAIYRNELRRIGVDMKPTAYEFSELLRIYEDKDFQAVVGGWQMDWDIDYKQLWHSSEAEVQGSSNHCGFRNVRVDELSDTLRTTFATDERIAIAKEIQAIIHEEQPYTFFKSGVGIFVWQNHAPPGSAPKPERYLAGVIKGFETFPPLTKRSRTFWHFRDR